MDYVSFFCTWCFNFSYVFWVLIFALMQMSHVLVWRLCTFWEGCYVIKFMWTTLVVGVDMVTHDNVNA
jgi:hypothetical protein